MAKPTNTIKKINPNGTEYDICPTMMTDSTGTYKAELPTLTKDEILATKSDIDNLPEPMVFKGGATITKSGSSYSISVTNPSTVSNIKEGYTYKIISAPSDDENFKVGDTLIADQNNPGSNPQTNWTLIPSGDEPSGTVTSVAMTGGTGLSVTGSPITTSGTLNVSIASGYKLPTTTEWNNKQPLNSRLTNITNIATATVTQILLLNTDGTISAGQIYQGAASGSFTGYNGDIS